jgi:predicted ATPase/DNA-binding XRE family transcriptional regulator
MVPRRPVTESFGDLLRRYRMAAGLTQEALAEHAGLSARGISDLERGINLRPHFETVRLLAEALDLAGDERAELVAAARPGDQPPPRSAPPRLPTPPTVLVGREAEVGAAVGALRRGPVRLLTLTGPGGVGKSRLALEIAHQTSGDYTGGAIWVDLAPLSSPDLVLPTIAHAVGVRETGITALADQLAERLREQSLLLVLDNVEHVLPAAHAISSLLAACPRLAVLATGREHFRLRGERVQPVEPLGVPDLGAVPSLADLGEAGAVQLFVARVADVLPGFALIAANATAIARICRRLDGLPLALELAAAWVRVLGPAALLGRLEAEPLALAGGARDLPARQHTLRATVAWSHDLLNPTEQRLFRRLAVFAGGFTPDAAVAIAEDGINSPLGAGLDLTPSGARPDALDTLAGLLDKSLVVRRDSVDGDTRMTMLETIREFAREQLAASGEEPVTREAHAAFYLAFAAQARAGLAGPQQLDWLGRLETEHDNLRASLRWLLDRGDGDRVLRLGGDLWWYWWVRGHLTEGRAWLAEALAVGSDSAPAVRGRALTGAGLLAEAQGDYDAARHLQEEALAVCRSASDAEGAARALGSLGTIAFVLGDFVRATALHEEALHLWEGLNNQHAAAYTLIDLGNVATRQGDAERARRLYTEALGLLRAVEDQRGVALALTNLGELEALSAASEHAASRYEEALALWRGLGDKEGMALVLANLGEVEQYRGNLDRARALHTQALHLCRELGAKHREAWALANLGLVERTAGDKDSALALLTEGLTLAHAGGDKVMVARCLEGLAGLAHDRGEVAPAGRLFGAAAALREAIGAPLPALYQPEITYDLACAAEAGGKTFLSALSAGRTLTLDVAVAEAITLGKDVG